MGKVQLQTPSEEKKKRFYLFTHERLAERGRDTEGKQASCRDPDVGLHPQTQDHSTTELPRCPEKIL